MTTATKSADATPTPSPFTSLVVRRHPEYQDRVRHWEFLQECYEGGRDWFKRNIFRYHKEGPIEFDQRVERAYRFNHSREVVDLLNKYLWRAEVSRRVEDAPPSVQKFWEVAAKRNMCIDDLMKQVSKAGSTFGRIYVVIDNNAKVVPVNVDEELKADIRTYAYVVKPQNALDMSFDDMGRLNWILIREFYRDDVDPMAVISFLLMPRYRLWTRTGWFLYQIRETADKTGQFETVLVDEGTHNLGEVPVIPVDHMESDNPYSTPALINDIAYLDRAVANYLSNLDAIIQDQTFSQLAMPAQAMIPGDETKIKEALIEMGTKRIFLYNGEGNGTPEFLSPDPRQAQLLITAIQTIINEIYHTVGLAGERTKSDNSQGIDNSSGVAKAYDFDRVNALLVSKADQLEWAENEIARIVALWNGQKVDPKVTPLVSYADNFDVRGLLDEFDIGERLALLDAPDEIRQEQMKTLVQKLFPAIKEELMAKLQAAILDWPKDPIELMQQMTAAGVAPVKAATVGTVTPPAAKPGKPAANPSSKRPTQGSPQS